MASLITDSDVFIEYKYRLSEFYINIGSEIIDLPTERITSFKIESYYEDAVTPIFRVSLRLDSKTYYKIVKNKNTTTFKIRIQKFYRKHNDENDKSLDSDFINGTFRLFMNADDTDTDDTLKKEDGTGKDELTSIDNNVDFFLFRKEVTKLRSTYNGVLDGTLYQFVEVLLTTAGLTKNLVSPFDNTNSYSDVILPPLRLDKELLFLSNTFGFHKRGTIMFFDLDCNYILNFKKGCTAYKSKEWKDTVIYVLDKNNTSGFLSGEFLRKKEKKFYLNVPPDRITPSNRAVTDNLLNGSVAVAINAASASRSSDNSGSTDDGNEFVISDNTSSPYTASAYAAMQKANNMVISLLLDNANVEAFNPNKNISVVFENTKDNKKYKGNYHTTTAVHIFTNKGDEFTVSTYAVLKRM